MRMQHSNFRTPLFFLFFSCLIFLCFSEAEAYKNYTVGESLGWFDALLKPGINYQKWVAGKNFSLGDFLLFNTDKNHSVIQTYNMTTYRKCDYDNAEEDDTVQWSVGEAADTTEAISVAVPLLKEGATYFFSGNYDGEQCKHGQHFKINVTHGQGLPNNLKTPTASPGPSSPNDDESAPDTVISSNFNNPVGGDDVKETSGLPVILPWKQGLVVLWGIVWVFG